MMKANCYLVVMKWQLDRPPEERIKIAVRMANGNRVVRGAVSPESKRFLLEEAAKAMAAEAKSI